jgi:hypothetical protein
MLFDQAREYEDVVHVYMDKAADAIVKYRGHQSLKCGRRIAVPHLPYLAPEGAKYRSECCLRHMSRIHVDLLICL